MSETFDPIRYSRPPVINAASGIALATSLISAMPKESPEMIRRTATIMRGYTVDLQSAWIAQDKLAKAGDRRSTDLWIDTGWSAVEGRLSSYAMLRREGNPLVERAEEIHGHLFGEDGLAFVNLPYDEEWAESAKRIEKIEKLGLADDLDRICGKEFRENLLAAHDAYGKVSGTTKPTTKPADARLAEPLRNLQTTIGRYGRQWAAAAEDSPELLAKAVFALEPIDRLRARQAPNATQPTQPEVPADPTRPIPDLPEPPLTD